MHGQKIAVPDDAEHFHIKGVLRKAFEQDSEAPVDVEVRDGTYSQVRDARYINEFEWDGWVTH